MGCDTANEYYQAIAHVEAQEVLLALKVADFPHVKQSERKKFNSYINKLASPKINESVGKALTTEDIAKVLGHLNRG